MGTTKGALKQPTEYKRVADSSSATLCVCYAHNPLDCPAGRKCRGAAPDIEGAWEGCQTELGAFVEHFYIEFNDDGSFRRVVLRDDRERPVVEELGEYRAGDGAVTLRYAANVGGLLAEQSEVVPFRVGGDTLYWGDAVSEIALVRVRAMDDGLLGTWGIRQFRRWVDRWTSDLPGGWDL